MSATDQEALDLLRGIEAAMKASALLTQATAVSITLEPHGPEGPAWKAVITRPGLLGIPVQDVVISVLSLEDLIRTMVEGVVRDVSETLRPLTDLVMASMPDILQAEADPDLAHVETCQTSGGLVPPEVGVSSSPDGRGGLAKCWACNEPMVGVLRREEGGPWWYTEHDRGGRLCMRSGDQVVGTDLMECRLTVGGEPDVLWVAECPTCQETVRVLMPTVAGDPVTYTDHPAPRETNFEEGTNSL